MSKREQSNLSVASPRRFTLAKSRILRGKRYFQRLFAEGTLIHTPLITLRYIIDEDPETDFKVGFIAPKRTGKAVDRNRSKRLLRESFRLQQHAINDLLAEHQLRVHMVFIAKKSLSNYSDVTDQVTSLLDKLRNRLLSQSTPN